MKTKLLGVTSFLALLVLLSTATFLLPLHPEGNAHSATTGTTVGGVTHVHATSGSRQIDLSPSYKAVSSSFADYGERITYTVGVRSANGPLTSTILFSDVIQEGLSFVPGTLTATSGTVNDTLAPTLAWSGILTPTPAVTITYAASVTHVISGATTLILPQTITNTALITAPDYGPITRSATVRANWQRIYLPTVVINAQTPLTEADWYMAGANPQRTSWVSEEVRESLDPIWYRPIEPYISQRVQIIAAYGTLYISTARGLYTLDAETGEEGWVYPTELPLGHSPTITNGIVYVGGFDRKLHAINASTGEGLWTFEAKAGFETSPLVVDGVVYAGNRDGSFYAVDAADGQLVWQYQTDGPIRYSAAYKDEVVFFASNDMHAYALSAQTGDLVWKSEKLAGAGFFSWWPVIYQDRIIFSGSHAYADSDPGIDSLGQVELDELYPNRDTDLRGTLIGALDTAPGDWAAGTPTIDAGRILSYFDQKPWRKTVFVLDLATGEEQETAPVLWASTRSGTRYPPVVGADGVLYQQNSYMSDLWIPGGQIAGWKPGNNHISVVSSDWGAVDEPHAAAGGGNLVYWNLCCDRQTGAFDVTTPNTIFAERYNNGNRPPTGRMDRNREWLYFNYDLVNKIPGYNSLWYNSQESYTRPGANYGGANGVYSNHADVNPPIPYKGRIYMHRSNAVIAFGDPGADAVALPMAETVQIQDENVTPLGVDYVQSELETEIQKMLDAGHLRPGYSNHGLFSRRARAHVQGCGDDLVDYWHHPGETVSTLIMALPHLPPALQTEVIDYVRAEFSAYPPYEYNHVGWQDGAAREAFDTPPEVAADMTNFAPETRIYGFHWHLNPFAFYTLWRYAEEFGDATTIFEASRNRLGIPPADDILLRIPHVHNAFIAGYLGYLELEDLAGYPESTDIRNELNRLLQLRSDNFAKDTDYTTGDSYYCRTLNVSNNFMFLVPELAAHLRENALSEVEAALGEYEEVAPYWFVAFASEGYAENAVVPLYDGHALFMAKALILEESMDKLERYLDVPGFAVGDLYYIQKLVTLLEKAGVKSPDP